MATESQASLTKVGPLPLPPPPTPQRRFFVEGKVSVDDVEAKFRDGKSIDTGHFFSLHDPTQPTFGLRLFFGSRFLNAYVFPKDGQDRMDFLKKLRIAVFTAEGKLLTSRADFDFPYYFSLFKRKSSSTPTGLDKLNFLIQFEYENPYTVDSTSPSCRLCVLREDLSSMFECGDYADIAFLVGDERIMGHKVILAGRCSYFARMFETDMKESDANEIEEKDIKPDVFVADGINSVGDYNSSPGGCRLSECVSVCVCVPTFFHVSRWDNF